MKNKIINSFMVLAIIQKSNKRSLALYYFTLIGGDFQKKSDYSNNLAIV